MADSWAGQDGVNKIKLVFERQNLGEKASVYGINLVVRNVGPGFTEYACARAVLCTSADASANTCAAARCKDIKVWLLHAACC